MVFTLLVVLTVSASSHPLEALDTTTTSSIDDPNKIFFTLPTGVGNVSQVPIRPSTDDESRLEITLKMDESDKEIVDSDMGKRDEDLKAATELFSVNLQKGFSVRRRSVNKKKSNHVCETNPETLSKALGVVRRCL